jgi:hypothetical protein
MSRNDAALALAAFTVAIIVIAWFDAYRRAYDAGRQAREDAEAAADEAPGGHL